MKDERPILAVETQYSYEINSLTLTQKDVEPQENPFYIQLVKFAGNNIRLQIRVDDGPFKESSVRSNEFTILQDTIREVIEKAGTAKIINLMENKIQIIHFENGEIGFGIGKGKYLLQENEAALLREYCLRVI